MPRELNRAAIGWLAGLGGFSALWFWVFVSDAPAIWITERDLELMGPIADHRVSWLTPAAQRVNEIGTHWATPVVGWSALVGALAARRVRHAALLVAALSAVAGIVTVVGNAIGRPRPLGVTKIGDWEGFAQPSRPTALLTAALVAFGLTLIPRPRRRAWHRLTLGLVLLFGFAQLYTGVEHPSDVLAGATVGTAVVLVLYRTLAPETAFPIVYDGSKTAHLDVTGPRGAAIERAMDEQLGLTVAEIAPIGLQGSAGSTPLCLRAPDDTKVFAKLYASTHLRSDRSYKLGRTLLYGRLEDEHRFTSVRRLIQHEDHMLHLFRAAGIPTAQPLAIIEITPDREYLLVTEFLDDAVEIGDAVLTENLIDQGLELVRRLWSAGLAHRDIKPANLMVQGDRLVVIDLAFAEVRPSPWRQAVDLANMMLVLALSSSAEDVYRRATEHFDEAEIAEAFAAARGVTLPSQLRAELRRDGRDLLGRFRALAPERPTVAIQRWSLRRLGLTVWVALITLLLVIAFVGNLSDIGLA